VEKGCSSSPDLGDPFYFLVQGYLATGRYQDAEKTAKVLVDLQTGKVAPTDRRFGIAHLFWARALAGQNRYEDALRTPRLPTSYSRLMQSWPNKLGVEAHQLLLDIKSRLASQ